MVIASGRTPHVGHFVAWDGGCLLTGGGSLSAAAHAAGFADAAHLSRTSRSTFGFPPSAMQMAGPLRVPDQPLRSIAARPIGIP